MHVKSHDGRHTDREVAGPYIERCMIPYKTTLRYQYVVRATTKRAL